jgi:hypothetical protein
MTVIAAPIAVLVACGELTTSSTPDGGLTGSDSGDEGGPSDAGSDVFADGTPLDEGGPVGKPDLVCEGKHCDPRTSVCCIGLPPFGNGTDCYGGDAARGDDAGCSVTWFACNDWVDCAHVPGTICCGRAGSDVGNLTGSTCETENDCDGISFHVTLCDPGNERPCPSPLRCIPVVGDGGSYAKCVP